LSSKCHNWWNGRKNWYYPVKGWRIRICKVCGQPQTVDREGYRDTYMDDFLKMIKWANDMDALKKKTRIDGLEWLRQIELDDRKVDDS